LPGKETPADDTIEMFLFSLIVPLLPQRLIKQSFRSLTEPRAMKRDRRIREP